MRGYNVSIINTSIQYLNGYINYSGIMKSPMKMVFDSSVGDQDSSKSKKDQTENYQETVPSYRYYTADGVVLV